MTTQDVFGTAVAANIGQKALVRGTVTAVSGSGETAQITVGLLSTGNTGDQSTTIVVGPKQFTTLTHPGFPALTQDAFGQVLDLVGRTALVRGTVLGISGTGQSAVITVSVDATGNPGDTNNTINVGPKQLAVQPAV